MSHPLKNKNPIIVVGGGPAGMMAAIRAGQLGCPVILVEKNASLGRKLLLTGKGRCNLTNAADLDFFLSRYSQGAFLRDAFKKFFNRDTMQFFEDRGVQLKVERQLRVFPVSDKSGSILNALKKEMKSLCIEILLQRHVRDIRAEGNTVRGIALSTGEFLKTEKVVWATGGKSYPLTGSTGEGVLIAGRRGHRIVPLRPGLVGLETVQRFPADLSGLTLRNVRLKFYNGKKTVSSEIGEVLFSQFGVSGPLVITHSGQVVDWLIDKLPVSVSIDLKPSLSVAEIKARLQKDIQRIPKKLIKNTLREYLPKRFIKEILLQAQIPREIMNHHMGSQERQQLALTLKDSRLDIKKPSHFKDAMVTRGGISLKAIHPRTMESRVIRGLYFAGEVIDIDGATGGFNLQAAFSTGFLAGESAALSRCGQDNNN